MLMREWIVVLIVILITLGLMVNTEIEVKATVVNTAFISIADSL